MEFASMNVPKETDIRKIKCGFVSLYVPFVCRKSLLLEKYDIRSIHDLYNLIMFGNEEHCSMFEALKMESWIAEHLLLPEHKWQWYLDYSKKRIIETCAVIRGFQLLVAVYLNVHIVMHPNTQKYKDANELERANEEVSQLQTAMQHITDPIETIDISLEPEHVEYLPRPEEESSCETIGKQLMNKHFWADEDEATQQMIDMCDSMLCDSVFCEIEEFLDASERTKDEVPE
jgi:hypothetical protein